MGGNALKNTYTRRYNKDEYFKLFEKIRLMYTDRPNSFKLLKSYNNKQTFGDMDIIINSNFVEKNLKRIEYIFKPNQIYNNGNVVSFDFEELQIDFIFINDRYYHTAKTYYDYNDLGNLMGRIARKLKVSYGHKGLFHKIYSEDGAKILREVDIVEDCGVYDTRKVFNFLGFDYDIYLNGFNEIEDIFKFVVNSKFFNKDIFSYENLDHANRVRNKKRKTYQDFIEYIEKINISGYEFPEDADFYLKRIDEYFPTCRIYEEVKIAKEREEKLKIIKEKFNGNIVSELTGLKDKNLGSFIYEFKKQYEDFDEFILNNEKEIIECEIFELLENFK